MQLVHLRIEDTEKLYQFYTGLSDTVAQTYRPFPEVTPEVLNEHIVAAVNGLHISMALEEDGVIYGHSFIIQLRSRHPVFGIGLDESVHGEGWGRKLMARVLAEAQEREISYITLTVLKYNNKAFSMYKSFGFKVVSDHTFKEKDDSYFMTRTDLHQ